MSIMFYLFEHPELKILESFCKDYIDLVERIVTLESDELKVVDEAFEKVKVDYYKGSLSNQYSKLSKKEIAKTFLLKKIDILNETVKRYSGTEKVMKDIVVYLKHHPNEIGKLKLVFKNFDIGEMYCNYLVVLEELKNIELVLNSHIKNK